MGEEFFLENGSFYNRRGFLIWNGYQNGGFQNGILLVIKNGFENDFIIRISTSFLSDFYGSKEFFWWIFQWIMEVWA